jgi:hypothetical protein
MDQVGTCQHCGQPYWMKHSKQKYCNECRPVVRSEQNNELKILSHQLNRNQYGKNARSIASDMRKAVKYEGR